MGVFDDVVGGNDFELIEDDVIVVDVCGFVGLMCDWFFYWVVVMFD